MSLLARRRVAVCYSNEGSGGQLSSHSSIYGKDPQYFRKPKYNTHRKYCGVSAQKLFTTTCSIGDSSWATRLWILRLMIRYWAFENVTWTMPNSQPDREMISKIRNFFCTALHFFLEYSALRILHIHIPFQYSIHKYPDILFIFGVFTLDMHKSRYIYPDVRDISENNRDIIRSRSNFIRNFHKKCQKINRLAL